MTECDHKAVAKLCPISKTVCPGECAFSDILEDLRVGIMVFDLDEESVFFQNKYAENLVRCAIRPRDYGKLTELFFPDGEMSSSDDGFRKSVVFGDKVLGYTVYNSTRRFLSTFVSDITQREREREEHARLITAMKSTHDIILMTDPEGRIEYVNPSFELITGFSKDYAMGKHLEAFLARDNSNGSLPRELREAMRLGTHWTGRLNSIKKDGTLYIEEATISPVRAPAGEIVNYVVVKRDVTEKVTLESIAEAVNTMNNIGYIFSGIRHELGNPINSMKTALTVLGNNLDRFSRDVAIEYISRIMAEVSRVEYLLHSLKNFNMYEHVAPQDTDVSSFMEKFLSLVSEDMRKRGIGVHAIIHPEVRWMRTDPRALQQVLLNVLTNASDALEGGEDPKIVISVFRMGGKVKFSLVDNGCGMSEEEQEKIFRPFQTSKAHGTGLGLVIARKMLASMNALIEISSSRDAGTIVEITLPEGHGGQP